MIQKEAMLCKVLQTYSTYLAWHVVLLPILEYCFIKRFRAETVSYLIWYPSLWLSARQAEKTQ